jgi:hypothetical protein
MMAREDMRQPEGGQVFVTVGTTLFDALIQAVDTPAFKKALLNKGCKKLVIQYGKGKAHPKEVRPLQKSSSYPDVTTWYFSSWSLITFYVWGERCV